MLSGLDPAEILRRAAKYLIEGASVGVAAWAVSQNSSGKSKLSLGEIVTIAVTAAAVFAILELYSPAIGASARTGAGLSLGAGIVGGVPVMR